jgi:L-asparaginase II
MPLYNQALAYKNLICSEKFNQPELTEACARIVKAVTSFPLMVAGTKRYCTDLMSVTRGRIIGKTGADGVYCLAIPEKKWGIAIKVDDGKMGPQYQIAHQLLKELKLISTSETEQLEKYGNFSIVNFAGNVVGDSYSKFINF